MTLLAFIITSNIACKNADQSFSAQNQNINANEGYAELIVSPTEVVFSDMEDGITYSASFTVESTGESILIIDKVDITDSAEGVFYIDTSATEDITLDPGVSRDFIIIAQSTAVGEYIGEARIRSNDSSNGDFRVTLCAFPLGYEGEQTCTPSTETEDTASETGEDTGTPLDTATE
mgnify:CR=1 FL=1